MSLIDSAKDPGADVYYSAGFRNMLESYLNVLRERSDTLTIQVEPQVGFKYEFDLYGLMEHYGVEPKLRWISMRMTGYNSSEEYKGEVITVLVPDTSNIERLRSLYNSSSS